MGQVENPDNTPLADATRRAIKIRQVLIAQATNRQTITYGKLAELIGNEVLYRALGDYLDRVADFCTAKNLPDLTVIVVRQSTGRPSGKAETPEDIDKVREDVYGRNWFADTPPTPDEI